MLNRLFKSEFVVNVATLMTGTAIAQAIPIAISPILTRIYTPDDFGVLALFLALTSVAAAIANGRYEQAILLPKEDKEALYIYRLALRISIGFSVFLLLLVVFFGSTVAGWLNNPEIEPWLWLIPISTLLTALYNNFNLYNIRKKEYPNVSKSLVLRSTSLAGSQVLIGLMAAGPVGLIVGQVFSYFTGNSMLYRVVRKDAKKSTNKSSGRVKEMAVRYKKFPLFSLPSVVLNSISLNSIPILISTIFSVTVLGFFSLAQRILGAPSRVLGTSISQVYYQKASQDFRDKGTARPIFEKTLVRLTLISLGVFIPLFFIAEPLFEFVFGLEWRIAGRYTAIIIPLAATRFVSSGLSPTVNIVQKQQISLYINACLLISSLLIFGQAHYEQIDFETVLIRYSIVLSLIYLFCIFIYWRLLIKPNPIEIG